MQARLSRCLMVGGLLAGVFILTAASPGHAFRGGPGGRGLRLTPEQAALHLALKKIAPQAAGPFPCRLPKDGPGPGPKLNPWSNFRDDGAPDSPESGPMSLAGPEAGLSAVLAWD